MALGSGKDLVPLSPALHGAGFFIATFLMGAERRYKKRARRHGLKADYTP